MPLPPLNAWLEKHGLDAYEKPLEDNGATELIDLISLSEEDLVELTRQVKMKFIHAHRFKGRIMELKQKMAQMKAKKAALQGNRPPKNRQGRSRTSPALAETGAFQQFQENIPSTPKKPVGVVVINDSERAAFERLHNMETDLKNTIDLARKRVVDVNRQAEEASDVAIQRFQKLKGMLDARLEVLLGDIQQVKNDQIAILQEHEQRAKDVLGQVVGTRGKGQKMVTQPVEDIGTLGERSKKFNKIISQVKPSVRKCVLTGDRFEEIETSQIGQIFYTFEEYLEQVIPEDGRINGSEAQLALQSVDVSGEMAIEEQRAQEELEAQKERELQMLRAKNRGQGKSTFASAKSAPETSSSRNPARPQHPRRPGDDPELIESPTVSIIQNNLDVIDIAVEFLSPTWSQAQLEVEIELAEVRRTKGKKQLKFAWQSLDFRSIPPAKYNSGEAVVRVILVNRKRKSPADLPAPQSQVDITIQTDIFLEPPCSFAARARLRDMTKRKFQFSDFSTPKHFSLDDAGSLLSSQSRPTFDEKEPDRGLPSAKKTRTTTGRRTTGSRRTTNYVDDSATKDDVGIFVLKHNALQYEDIGRGKKVKLAGGLPVDVSSFPGFCEGVIVYDPNIGIGKQSVDSVYTRGTAASDVNEDKKHMLFRVGGRSYSDGVYQPTVDVLDLAAGQWAALPEMNNKRAYLQAVVVQNTLIAIGGKDENSYLDVVEEYDFDEHTWEEVSPMLTPRYDHAACVFASDPSAGLTDRVFVCGGFNTRGHVADTEMYDYENQEWLALAPMRYPRNRCSAFFWSAKNQILVVGGLDASGKTKNIAELYDVATNNWRTIASLTEPHDDYPASGVYDGKPFVVGNAGQLGPMEVYDDRSDSWNVIKTYPTSRHEVRRFATSSLMESRRGSSWFFGKWF